MDYFDSLMLSILFDERNVRRAENIYFHRARIDIVKSVSNFVKQRQPSCLNKLFYYIFLPFTIISFSAVSVWVCLSLRAKQKAMQNARRIKENVRNGSFPYTFPVFLLFCDRGNFVTDRFIPALSNSLREIFEGDEVLVSTEDEHFWPGKSRIQETERLFNLSAVVLVIVSAEVLHDPFIMKQVEIACVLRKPVFLLLTEEIDEEMLPFSWMGSEIMDIEVNYIDGTPVELIGFDFNMCEKLLEMISEALP